MSTLNIKKILRWLEQLSNSCWQSMHFALHAGPVKRLTISYYWRTSKLKHLVVKKLWHPPPGPTAINCPCRPSPNHHPPNHNSGQSQWSQLWLFLEHTPEHQMIANLIDLLFTCQVCLRIAEHPLLIGYTRAYKATDEDCIHLIALTVMSKCLAAGTPTTSNNEEDREKKQIMQIWDCAPQAHVVRRPSSLRPWRTCIAEFLQQQHCMLQQKHRILYGARVICVRNLV